MPSRGIPFLAVAMSVLPAAGATAVATTAVSAQTVECAEGRARATSDGRVAPSTAPARPSGGAADLEQCHRLPDAAKVVRSAVLERHAGGALLADRRDRGARQQDLPATR